MERTVDDILALVRFTSETIARRMVKTLNRVLDIQGYVTISVLCDKMEIDISQDERAAFDWVFWRDRITDDAVHPIIEHEEIAGYGITFPELYTEIGF